MTQPDKLEELIKLVLELSPDDRVRFLDKMSRTFCFYCGEGNSTDLCQAATMMFSIEENI